MLPPQHPPVAAPPAPRDDADFWRWLAAGLIALASLAHLTFLVSPNALDLAPDEAHYWDWSRHLDWSYYSKGPLVAWLIRAGCTVAGPLSRELTGSPMLAVRLPAVLCGALLLASLYTLTARVFGSARLACGVVALALTLPPVAVGAEIMTIDAPYTCCWGWALVLGHVAVVGRRPWAWPACGLVVGVGILAKYTMVLFLPSLGLFLLFSSYRRDLLRPGFWVLTAVTALACLPILVWNVNNGWVTVRHVNRLAGLAGAPAASAEPSWHPLGPLIYLAAQAGLLLGFWFLAWAAALWDRRPGRDDHLGRRYLWWTSVPMFAVFLAFSVRTRGGEPNWPITAYLSGLVLTADWLAARLAAARGWTRLAWQLSIAAACLLGLGLTAFLHRADRAYPLLARLTGPPTSARPLPLRRLDPTCRLRGWRTLAARVDDVRERLRRQGVEPVLAGTSWWLPGEVGFYCAGHPPVVSLGPALGDRKSQYDLWHPNPLAEPGDFAGRTFIVIGPASPDLGKAFASVDPPRTVTHLTAGQPVARWAVSIARDFHGFPRHPGTPADY